MRRSIFMLAFGMALALSASAQVYKWTDPAGKVHYGDRPPDDAKTEQLKLDVRSYDGPVQVTDWAAILRKKSSASPAARGITMYSTSWCVHCKRARNYFKENGIRYNEVDVEASEANQKEFKELGGGGVPLILVGDKAMRGFSEEHFQALMKKS
jgi:glutaredoxin